VFTVLTHNIILHANIVDISRNYQEGEEEENNKE
jgi:hypothetical protein